MTEVGFLSSILSLNTSLLLSFFNFALSLSLTPSSHTPNTTISNKVAGAHQG